MWLFSHKFYWIIIYVQLNAHFLSVQFDVLSDDYNLMYTSRCRTLPSPQKVLLSSFAVNPLHSWPWLIRFLFLVLKPHVNGILYSGLVYMIYVWFVLLGMFLSLSILHVFLICSFWLIFRCTMYMGFSWRSRHCS